MVKIHRPVSLCPEGAENIPLGSQLAYPDAWRLA